MDALTTTKSIPTAPNGFATSLPQDTSRQAMLTSAASRTFDQMTLLAIRNATSLLVSESGATPFVLPDGTTVDPFGLARALASLSARQVRALGLQTSGISGPHGSISSASAALQSCLESRLKQRLPMAGSTLFKMTWKQKATPSLRSVSLLRASALRTSGNDSGSWPTPTKTQAGGTPENFNARKRRHRTCSDVPTDLGLSAKYLLSAWPTPMASHREQTPKHYKRGNPNLAAVASWSTPTAQDHSRGTKPPRPQDTGVPLSQQVSALTPNGFSAETAKAGQLNPEFSLWLMGIPAEWACCAPRAMPSIRKSPLSSSAPLRKVSRK